MTAVFSLWELLARRPMLEIWCAQHEPVLPLIPDLVLPSREDGREQIPCTRAAELVGSSLYTNPLL